MTAPFEPPADDQSGRCRPIGWIGAGGIRLGRRSGQCGPRAGPWAGSHPGRSGLGVGVVAGDDALDGAGLGPVSCGCRAVGCRCACVGNCAPDCASGRRVVEPIASTLAGSDRVAGPDRVGARQPTDGRGDVGRGRPARPLARRPGDRPTRLRSRRHGGRVGLCDLAGSSLVGLVGEPPPAGAGGRASGARRANVGGGLFQRSLVAGRRGAGRLAHQPGFRGSGAGRGPGAGRLRRSPRRVGRQTGPGRAADGARAGRTGRAGARGLGRAMGPRVPGMAVSLQRECCVGSVLGSRV